MELYIHIPFCRQKCRYCDFPSYAGCEQEIPRYIDALMLEAREQAELLPVGTVMDTVFIGGGTPSLLTPEQLKKLANGIQDVFFIAQDAEFTCEANPGTVTAEWAQMASACGVNRVSMGMQALQPHLLKTLGRIHQYDDVCASVQSLREAGIQDLNLDLMFGLPGQSRKDWSETIEAALALSPTHLSCYGLIPEEGTPLTADLEAGRLSLPDEEIERQMYDDCLQLLSVRGFRQYEISNFALPGHACRHNIGYWRQVPYLGLGASAASALPVNTAETAYRRLANPPTIPAYMQMVTSHGLDRQIQDISPA